MSVLNPVTQDFPIAVKPAEPRDSCRLLVFDRRQGNIEHLRFWDIARFFEKSDVLVVNASAVFPARLPFLIGEFEGDILLLDRPGTVKLVRAKMQRRSAQKLNLNQGQVQFLDGSSGKIMIERFDQSEGLFFLNIEMSSPLEKVGQVPLPPYIVKARKSAGLPEVSPEDVQKYQCVYAEISGSAACPTAGLHWTPDRLKEISDKGVRISRVIHHVGLASIVHVSGRQEVPAEEREVEPQTAQLINEARRNSQRVIACGTSTVRALESSVGENNQIVASRGATDLFIRPGFVFRAVDAMLTNFHLPDSTNFMMTQAFAGEKHSLLAIYQEAASKGYQFYSYGDAMLIL